MAAENGKGDRRLAFLEKVYLEDRERWRANDARMQRMLGHLAENSLAIKRLEERLDSTWRILRRVLER